MYIITNRNEKNDEELSQKIVRLKKKKTKFKSETRFWISRTERKNREKRIFYYGFAMLWTESFKIDRET